MLRLCLDLCIILMVLTISVHTLSIRYRRQDIAVTGDRNLSVVGHNESDVVPPTKPPLDQVLENTTVVVPVDMGGDSDKNTTVMVIMLVVVLLLVSATGIFIFIRVRRRRMADFEKKTQIQMSSTTNAGVYMDLTVAAASARQDNKEHDGSPETERLNSGED